MAKKIITSGLGKPMPLQELTILKEVDNSKDWSSASVFVLGGGFGGFGKSGSRYLRR